MNNELSFDVLSLKPLTSYGQWLKKYRNNIRVNITWRELKKPGMGLCVVNKDTHIVLPRYEKGRGWRDGTPKTWKLGTNPALCRLPAIKKGGLFFVIDGVHRLIGLNPCFVVLDYIEPSKKEWVYITDFFNEKLRSLV